jgi:hypothetical protein
MSDRCLCAGISALGCKGGKREVFCLNRTATLVLLLIASLTFELRPAHATPAPPLPYDFGGQNSPLYNRAQLSGFADDRGYHYINITRDHSPTYGDRSVKGADGRPLLPMTQLQLPRFVDAQGKLPGWVLMKDRATGYLMTVCTGTGCQYRIPMIWTQPMLDRVAGAMGIAMANCDRQTAKCELKGVQRAMTIMEVQFRQKLDRMSSSEIHAYMVTNAYYEPYTQDCVDQAYNGTAYLMILADAGLMKLFKVYYPGFTWLHNYTRLQALNGGVISLDLYHRGSGVGTGAYVPAVRDPLSGAL